MDGFTDFETAAAETVPGTTSPPWAGDALDRCRQRAQQLTCRHRGRSGDPLYGIGRVLRTGAELLADKQKKLLTAVFADDAHVQVEATWLFYQRIVAANRDPNDPPRRAP